MSGMAEVLAAHQQGVFADECRGCKLANDGRAYRGFDLAKHQEDMLTAAGFGPVKEAAAKALEDAADGWSDWDALEAPEAWLCARAAAVRGEA